MNGFESFLFDPERHILGQMGNDHTSSARLPFIQNAMRDAWDRWWWDDEHFDNLAMKAFSRTYRLNSKSALCWVQPASGAVQWWWWWCTSFIVHGDVHCFSVYHVVSIDYPSMSVTAVLVVMTQSNRTLPSKTICICVVYTIIRCFIARSHVPMISLS